MIEGLKFDFTSDDLRRHLADKRTHHAEREQFYLLQAKSLEDNKAEGMQYSGGDPIKALRDKSAQHRQKKEMFGILHEHIVPHTVYRLEEKDLTRLELISSGYF